MMSQCLPHEPQPKRLLLRFDPSELPQSENRLRSLPVRNTFRPVSGTLRCFRMALYKAWSEQHWRTVHAVKHKGRLVVNAVHHDKPRPIFNAKTEFLTAVTNRMIAMVFLLYVGVRSS